MNKTWLAILLGLTVLGGCAQYTQVYEDGGSDYPATTSSPVDAYEDSTAAVDFFYERLEPYGDWTQVEDYGWAWRPRHLSRDWRPYTDGRWLWTEDGWSWVSDWEDEWGWATFHYGRWYDSPRWGWVWVPGLVWAPAWVEWRYGGGWVGWAPLPPLRHRHSVYLTPQVVERDIIIAPGHFCFVEDRYFVEPGVHRHIVTGHQNHSLIRITNNVTNYVYVNNRAVNRSFDARPIEKRLGRPVPRVRLVDQDAIHPQGQRDRDRDWDRRELPVYRPRVTTSPARTQAWREARPSKPMPASSSRDRDADRIPEWSPQDRTDTYQPRRAEPGSPSRPEYKSTGSGRTPPPSAFIDADQPPGNRGQADTYGSDSAPPSQNNLESGRKSKRWDSGTESSGSSTSGPSPRERRSQPYDNPEPREKPPTRWESPSTPAPGISISPRGGDSSVPIVSPRPQITDPATTPKTSTRIREPGEDRPNQPYSPSSWSRDASPSSSGPATTGSSPSRWPSSRGVQDASPEPATPTKRESSRQIQSVPTTGDGGQSQSSSQRKKYESSDKSPPSGSDSAANPWRSFKSQ